MSQSSSGFEYGKFPAVISSYEASSRECIIKTPLGDEIDAEIMYPIGDDSRLTEIKINVGDKVWCEYIQGDTRRALITGFRNPQIGNTTGTRRFEQENIVLKAGQKIELEAGSSITAKVGGMILEITSDDIKANGISVIKHVHLVIKEGQDTDKPK